MVERQDEKTGSVSSSISNWIYYCEIFAPGRGRFNRGTGAVAICSNKARKKVLRHRVSFRTLLASHEMSERIGIDRNGRLIETAEQAAARDY
jgi:hypothetical protein